MEWGSGSSCTAAILICECPLWVISGHRSSSNQCPLLPPKAHIAEWRCELQSIGRDRHHAAGPFHFGPGPQPAESLSGDVSCPLLVLARSSAVFGSAGS